MLGKTPDPWIGDRIPVKEGPVPLRHEFPPLPKRTGGKRFEETSENAKFLRLRRSKFVEERRNGGTFSALTENEIDFVMPETLSTNTVSILPVVRDAEGEYFVGVERRELPGCEIREGNAEIFTVPAFRLPKRIDSYVKLEGFIHERFDSDPEDVAPLGEAFFPSLGISPEKSYPYAVTGNRAPFDADVAYVPLRHLFRNAEKIRDFQLLVSVFRLTHALGVWEEYATKANGKTTVGA